MCISSIVKYQKNLFSEKKQNFETKRLILFNVGSYSCNTTMSLHRWKLSFFWPSITANFCSSNSVPSEQIYSDLALDSFCCCVLQFISRLFTLRSVQDFFQIVSRWKIDWLCFAFCFESQIGEHSMSMTLQLPVKHFTVSSYCSS